MRLTQGTLFGDSQATFEPLVRFFVPGTPQPRGSKMPVLASAVDRHACALELPGNCVVYVKLRDANPKSYAWMEAIRSAARDTWAQRRLLLGPVAIDAEFRFHHSHRSFANTWHCEAPDADKLQRALGDAMSGIVYDDDRQIGLWVNPRKLWTAGPSGVEVAVGML